MSGAISGAISGAMFCATLCTLSSACASSPSIWKFGVATPHDDPHLVNAVARVEGRPNTSALPITPTAQLRAGLTGFDLGVGAQGTWSLLDDVSGQDGLYTSLGVDLFHLGRSRDFWYAGAIGPYAELGWRRFEDETRQQWWSVSVVVDHDMRLGPRHRTFVGLMFGWTPEPPSAP